LGGGALRVSKTAKVWT